ncbi:MAG: prepilin-type N-terminal cleavage/methylation domain-containing protein [Phycisphaeraceae bacterium]|nr:prepilin-type N-terminal cleavage/methylation domain-containing protein [Phycisphaeraceae bacterium]
MKNQRTGFTLIELLVVISIIALLIAILLPALGAARKTARITQSNTQMRGMQQALVIFSHDNKEWFPGIQSSGNRWAPPSDNLANDYGSTVEARFALLIEGDFFTPDYAIHPNEPNEFVNHTPYAVGSGDVFTIENFSYAMQALSVNDPTSTAINQNETIYVRKEWQQNLNSQSIVISDRLMDVGVWGDPTTYRSAWSTKEGDQQWGVAWNDNHVTYENLAVFKTKYGPISNTADDLYSRSLTGAGNVQSPSAPGINNGGNAFMVSRKNIGARQRP